MNKTFKGFMTPPWTLTDTGITFKNEHYPFSQMTNVQETNTPNSGLTNGVIQVYIAGKSMPLTLGYAFKEKQKHKKQSSSSRKTMVARSVKSKIGNEPKKRVSVWPMICRVFVADT